MESAGIIARFKLLGDKSSCDTAVEIVTEADLNTPLWRHDNIRQLQKVGGATHDSLRDEAVAAVQLHFGISPPIPTDPVTTAAEHTFKELNMSTTSSSSQGAMAEQSWPASPLSAPLSRGRATGDAETTAASPLQRHDTTASLQSKDLGGKAGPEGVEEKEEISAMSADLFSMDFDF